MLFTRLLREAEANLSTGTQDEAETQCCQVLTGAVTLGNADLIEQAASLLHRIPQTDERQRRTTVWHLSNLIAKMQNGTDRIGALRLCDALLLATEGLPYEQLNALNLALYITGSNGMAHVRHPSYSRYLDQLIAYERRAADSDATELSLEMTVDAGAAQASHVLANRGMVLVRQLFEPAQLAPWREGIIDFFATSMDQAACIDKIGDPKTLIQGQAKSFLDEVMQPFFYFTPDLLLCNSFFRRVEARRRETSVPFHQDVNAFGRLMINVWTPLLPCGRDAPGLAVVARRTTAQIETAPADNQYDELQILESTVVERFGEGAIFRPEMEPGDVLILLGTTIHRTHVTPAMTEPRLSLELRFSGA